MKNKESKSKFEKQKLLASIDIFDDSIIASRYDQGLIFRRYVSVSDLTKIFETAGSKVMQWMPINKNVVAVGTDSDGQQRYMVVRPARRTLIEIHIGKRRYFQMVRMPNLLAELVAEKSEQGPRFKDVAKVFAFGGKLHAQTQLYVPPLPNVYPTGNVCMGTINVRRWSSLDPAEVFEVAFIRSPFTDHLLEGQLVESVQKKYRNVIDALKKTKGNVPLKIMQKVKTYAQIFKD